MDYKLKYLKYKGKYLSIKNKINNQLGGSSTKSIIILDGTSSSGKSTIVKYFDSKKKYKAIGIEFIDEELSKVIKQKYNDYLKNIPNEYAPVGRREIYNKIWTSEVLNDGLKAEKGIIDTIFPQMFIDEIKRRGLDEKLYTILLYTGINDLARNLESRRKEGDFRQLFFVFNEFTERYTKSDEDGIDTVNRKKFNEILLDNFKYEFKNKEELDKFSINIFEKMGINDDNDHFIKVRDEIEYNYLLNTVGKSQEEIFKEAENILDQLNDSKNEKK